MIPVSIHTPGAPQKTCARCNLPDHDDGLRVRIHGGKGFLCRKCKPRTT